ncbi:hypothetical protein C493_08646 [Natronolimnohabitans innermongolicus JCM 12255]|uniref:Uncharacterized protein n=1 Tax=Natronolimnohabitans innermongolicus JCM 12255 TaxID=1227499 RepID=L9X6Z8_9EURY|nr:hypothetical protein C493_08646 [Natronolimnohabitans innermongolicus JCM 12255]
MHQEEQTLKGQILTLITVLLGELTYQEHSVTIQIYRYKQICTKLALPIKLRFILITFILIPSLAKGHLVLIST